MSVREYRYKPEMTFSTKKVILMIAELIADGQPAVFIEEDVHRNPDMPFYRFVRVEFGNKKFIGETQADLFNKLFAELKTKIKGK